MHRKPGKELVGFPEHPLAAYQSQFGGRVRINLGASTIEPPTLQELLQLAKPLQHMQWQELSLAYASERGDEELRGLLSKRYPGLCPDDIVLCNGAQEALFCAFKVLICESVKVTGLSPRFPPLASLPVALGGDLQEVRLPFRDGAWQFDLKGWTRACGASTDVAVINFPHNPTGVLPTRDTFCELVADAKAKQLWLASDEVFRGLEMDEGQTLPPAASLYEKAVSIGSIAKPFGLGGLRVGWIACADPGFIERVLDIKRSLSICCGRTDEFLATIALENADSLRRRALELLNINRTRIQQALPKLERSIECGLPAAGCVTFPRLPHVNAKDFAEQLADLGVGIVPGEFFGGPSFANFFRLGFGRRDFADGFQILENHLTSSSRIS